MLRFELEVGPRELKAIGEEFGVTKQAVSQWEGAALRTLAAVLAELLADDE